MSYRFTLTATPDQSGLGLGNWEEEYKHLRVIPSTTRLDPSKALKLFGEFLDFSEAPLVLDAGCGNGRNAFYLASKGSQVVAVDFSKEALSKLEQGASQRGLSARITPARIDLLEPLRFPGDTFQLCLDSYFSCHLLDDAGRDRFLSEIRRVMAPGGFFFTSLFSPDDQYYATIGRPVSSKPNVVMDPHNSIAKRLYHSEEIRRYLEPFFSIRYLIRFEFSDVVIGKPFTRIVYAILAAKRTG